MPNHETFPLVTTIVIMCTSACCALASTDSSLATRYGTRRLAAQFAKFAGAFLELASVRMLVSTWLRQRSGFFVVHSILFRALSVTALLCNLQTTGKLLTPATTGMGVIAPLTSTSLLPLVQRASLICTMLLYTPFLYCYGRFQWKMLALLVAINATSAFWLPVMGAEPAAFDSTLARLWRTMIEGTGKIAGAPPNWCAHITAFYVVSMTWIVGFAGRAGLGVCTMVAAIISHSAQLHAA